MAIVGPLLKSVAALFIILDPIGLIPVFLAVTLNYSPQERRTVLTRATLVALGLLLVFTFVGTGILRFFGISINDFKIAGGILLMVIALRIINEAHYGETGGGSGVVPLAVPLLVGPGAITTTIVLLETNGLWITLAAVLITFGIIFIIFRSVGFLYRILGNTGSDVVAKIMGMLLAAIAVQFIRQGIQAIFHI